MPEYSSLKQPSPEHVYRAIIKQIDELMALGHREAGLWVKGDNDEHHLVKIWDATWRDTLKAMRAELESSIYNEIERQRGAMEA